MLQNQNNKDESYHESRAAGKAKMKKSFGLQLMILNKLSVWDCFLALSKQVPPYVAHLLYEREF